MRKLLITLSSILLFVLVSCWYHRATRVEWKEDGSSGASRFYTANYTCWDGSLRSASVTENPSEFNYHGALTNPSGMRGGAVGFHDVTSAKKYAAKRLVASCW
jgi:hypothetical protein